MGEKGVVPSFKILVVDDAEDFRRFVRSVLQQRDEFQVAEASDGLQAIQKAKELQPDLILLDIGLPSLDGLEVARRVRAFGPVRILFVSGMSDPEVVREALRLGAGYVRKVHAHGDLLPAIEAVLEGKRFVGKGLEFTEDKNAEVSRWHEILVCSDDAAFLQGLTRFIAAALNRGNPVMVQTTELHQDRLIEKLRHEGVDIDAAIQRGTYISSDAAAPRDPSSVLAAVRDLSDAAARAGNKHPRVALCGERAVHFWAKGETEAAFCLERFFSELARANDVDILCVYLVTQGQEDDPTFKLICAEHSVVSYR
jgi:CheY-like chemotaxis protein